MFSVCSHLGGGGGYPGQVQMGGGYPSQVQVGGYPSQVGGTLMGGTPPQVTPPSDLAWWGGTLTGGTPPQVPPVRPLSIRVPPVRSDWGYLRWGTPARYPTFNPPGQTWPGGTPPRVPPQSDLAGGVPWWRRVWQGYPRWGTPVRVPPRPGLMAGYLRWGTPHRGTPHLAGVPPHLDLAGAGVPHRVVLNTPRSVCLLRSRRRTFLFYLSYVLGKDIYCCEHRPHYETILNQLHTKTCFYLQIHEYRVTRTIMKVVKFLLVWREMLDPR